jgi:hypothetical protein
MLACVVSATSLELLPVVPPDETFLTSLFVV